MSFDSAILRIRNSNLAKDSFWALLGSTFGKGLSLLAGILVARYLGKEMYGQYGILKNTLLNIAVFSTLGLGYTGTRFIAKNIAIDVSQIIHIIYRVSLVSSSIIALLVFVFSAQIALFLKASTLDWALKITSVIIIFNAVNTAQIGILSGFKAFKHIARNNIYSGVIIFLSSGLFSYWWALDGALLALLISTCFNAVINYCTINKFRKLYPQIEPNDKTKAKEIILFSIPIALQESMYTVVHFLSSYLLITYAGYGELGITSAAAQWSSMLLFIPGVMKNVMLSYFSSNNSVDGLRRKMIIINAIATFIPWSIIAALSGFITSFYGKTFTNLNIVLIISCMSAIFSSISSVVVYEFISTGRNWEMFFLRLLRDGTSLLLAWICLSRISTIQGAIISSSVYTSVAGIFMIVLLLYKKKFKSLSS